MPSSHRSEIKSKSGPVLSAVMQMMDQGPQPMRNMKPAKKNPNSADSFDSDHQAAYESYDDRVSDRSSAVHDHNAASPKMKDELDRRKSISKPKAPSIMLAKSMYYDPRCRACQKLKQAETKKMEKKRNVKPKKEKKRRTDKKARVTKKRAQKKVKSKLRLARVRTNKGCQYSVFNKGTSVDGKVDGESEVIFFSGWRRSKPSQGSQAALTNPSANGSKSDVVSQNPDTSVNSLSSYNSNMSLDHEPMLHN